MFRRLLERRLAGEDASAAPEEAPGAGPGADPAASADAREGPWSEQPALDFFEP
jgi:hypothetical protein